MIGGSVTVVKEPTGDKRRVRSPNVLLRLRRNLRHLNAIYPQQKNMMEMHPALK